MRPDKAGLDTYLRFVNEEMQTAKLASEAWFRSAPKETVARNDRFVRSLVGSVLPPRASAVAPVSDRVDPVDPVDPVVLRKLYWRRVARAKPVAVRFGAPDLGRLEAYFDVAADRSTEAVLARLRREITRPTPGHHLLRSVDRLASASGMSHAAACRATMTLLSRQWTDLVRQCQAEQRAAGPTAERVFARFHDSISAGHATPPIPRQGRRAATARARRADVRLPAAQARELARTYMLARFCFTDEEFRVARELARSPRLRYALLAAHLHLVRASTGPAVRLAADWGTTRALLPFTEAFVDRHGYRGSVVDPSPNPKLIGVMCNNLLPAVAGELLRKGARADELDAGILAEGIQAAVRRGVFSVTIGLFHRTAARDLVSLAGFSRRACPAARPFGTFCGHWLPHFFERYPGDG